MAEQTALTGLGARVRRRREAMGMTIDVAAEAGPMSAVTWGRVEKGLKVRRLSYSSVDRVLGWRPGACLDFLEHGTEPGPPASRAEVAEETRGVLEGLTFREKIEANQRLMDEIEAELDDEDQRRQWRAIRELQRSVVEQATKGR